MRCGHADPGEGVGGQSQACLPTHCGNATQGWKCRAGRGRGGREGELSQSRRKPRGTCRGPCSDAVRAHSSPPLGAPPASSSAGRGGAACPPAGPSALAMLPSTRPGRTRREGWVQVGGNGPALGGSRGTWGTSATRRPSLTQIHLALIRSNIKITKINKESEIKARLF